MILRPLGYLAEQCAKAVASRFVYQQRKVTEVQVLLAEHPEV